MNENLKKQMKKLCRENSHNDAFLTRKTYATRMTAFLDWASARGLQRIQNIKNTQVADYISQQLDKGTSARTLRATMSAIRYFTKMSCDKTNRETKLTITNEQLGIMGKAQFEYRDGIDKKELEAALEYSKDCYDINVGIRLGYALGLRSNEIYNIRLYEILNAIDNGDNEISIAYGTKGGRKRTVVFDETDRVMLVDVYKTAKSNGKHLTDKVLCGNEKDDCKRQLAAWHNWWSRNAQRVSAHSQTPRTSRLSAHCLRRQYARNLFERELESGNTPNQAAEKVSLCLGHGRGRADITSIYLGMKV